MGESTEDDAEEEDEDVGAGEFAAEEGDEEDVVLLPLRLSPFS